MQYNKQFNCWSLRCSWSIAWRRCSNYIFILDLTVNTCLQYIAQIQLQIETKTIFVLWFDVLYIRDFTVFLSVKEAPWLWTSCCLLSHLGECVDEIDHNANGIHGQNHTHHASAARPWLRRSLLLHLSCSTQTWVGPSLKIQIISRIYHVLNCLKAWYVLIECLDTTCLSLCFLYVHDLCDN